MCRKGEHLVWRPFEVSSLAASEESKPPHQTYLEIVVQTRKQSVIYISEVVDTVASPPHSKHFDLS